MEDQSDKFSLTDCIRQALEQCNRIESSIENCLRVLHETSFPKLTDLSAEEQAALAAADAKWEAEMEAEAEAAALLLEQEDVHYPGEGDLTSEGLKPSDLVGNDEKIDLSYNDNIRNLLKSARLKLEQVMSSQQRISQRLGDAHDGLLIQIEGLPQWPMKPKEPKGPEEPEEQQPKDL